MGKLSNNTHQTLPEFQKFLLERKLVPEKNVTFFAYWVSRFLDFARKRDLSDIRTIQELLGHSNLQTTMIYTHMASKNILSVRSPLDK